MSEGYSTTGEGGDWADITFVGTDTEFLGVVLNDEGPCDHSVLDFTGSCRCGEYS